MAADLKLKIITPDRIVLETDVEEVMAHAIDGGFSVLKGHEPLVTALAVDVLKYKTNGGENFAAVMGGILEVANNEVTVLSDLAELEHEIDHALAVQEKERAEALKTERKFDDVDVQRTEVAVSRAIARIRVAELAGRRKHHTNP